ncbi:BSD-domain-containing protein [Periconia macrospinosa]|uniref:BSD-domain-containing protein n=1 Tax=Periconia macrospinosa TaxID=97972 RepID=A0A2V1DSH1_9PLEO|nr:BSD-domain-containing protein [Periconia macrospinosa]
MDTAYDHVQQESYPEAKTPQSQDSSRQESANINTEIQDAYKAISSSPWAARLGGFLGSVKKQGEQYYESANKQATTGLSTLISHTRNISVTAEASSSSQPSSSTETSKDARAPSPITDHPDRPESLPADIIKEAEGILSRFRSEATRRLKDMEKAEDAADEALLKFGTNIRNYLRDAVTIAPPEAGASPSSQVLYESKDREGKKVVHATRFDAQLHVIHSSLDSFLKDPVSPEWENWKKSFDAEKKTGEIAKDLEKHEQLRTAMEKLVPEKVEYSLFWTRYYFLRHVIESEEQRRREMLKASTPADEEEVAWDEDSDSDSDADADAEPTSSRTPQPPTANLSASKETLKPITPSTSNAAKDGLKPAGRRSNDDEKSVADSDASYDLVSGATSRAPGSPTALERSKNIGKVEESDEEDWE